MSALPQVYPSLLRVQKSPAGRLISSSLFVFLLPIPETHRNTTQHNTTQKQRIRLKNVKLVRDVLTSIDQNGSEFNLHIDSVDVKISLLHLLTGLIFFLESLLRFTLMLRQLSTSFDHRINSMILKPKPKQGRGLLQEIRLDGVRGYINQKTVWDYSVLVARKPQVWGEFELNKLTIHDLHIIIHDYYNKSRELSVFHMKSRRIRQHWSSFSPLFSFLLVFASI